MSALHPKFGVAKWMSEIRSTAPTGLSSAINARPVTTVRTSKPNRRWSKRRDAASCAALVSACLAEIVSALPLRLNVPAVDLAHAYLWFELSRRCSIQIQKREFS